MSTTFEELINGYDLKSGKYLSVATINGKEELQLKESKLLKTRFLGRLYRRFVVSPKFGNVILWLSKNNDQNLINSLRNCEQIKNSISHYFDNGKKHKNLWSKVQGFIKTTWPQLNSQSMNSTHVDSIRTKEAVNENELTDEEWIEKFKKDHCYFDSDLVSLKESLAISPKVIKELKEILSYKSGMILYFSLAIGTRPAMNAGPLIVACKQLDLKDDSFFVIVPWHRGVYLPLACEMKISGLDNDECPLYFWNNIQVSDEKPILTDQESEKLNFFGCNYRRDNLSGLKGNAISNANQYIEVTKQIRKRASEE